ncbi:MAG: 5'/3'-nucleotidase SurE [Dehalococcoidia bacterium]|jgi:5'-nucleotidase|nr:5'/3'-nucleotidase SurE [Dehalococcoidia bacterium]
MRILLTNDDGIGAPGLWAVAAELARVGDLTVAAPGEERSGAGTSISLRKPIWVQEVSPQVEGVRAFSVSGTPADSAILAISCLFPGEFDLVVSGINRGSNLGHDVYVSGTVGAAMQGYLHNIPAMAVSMYAYVDINYSTAARMAGLLARKVGEGAIDGPLFLNVNSPNLDPDRVAGVDITRISRKNYCDRIEKDYDTSGEYFIITRNDELEDALPGTDLWAVENGRVSITPLPDRVVSEQLVSQLRALVPELEAGLRSPH